MLNQTLKEKTKYLLSIVCPEEITKWACENKKAKSLAMVGRSNVGKSTLINSLFGKKTARTSKTPGRTRAINIFEFETQKGTAYLYDLPGYGHAKVSKATLHQWNLLMDAYFSSVGPQTLIINIQDARHPGQEADGRFHQYFKNFDLPAYLVFNKIDQLKNQRERAVLAKQKQTISQNYPNVLEIFYLSAKSLEGLGPLESSLSEFLS